MPPQSKKPKLKKPKPKKNDKHKVKLNKNAKLIEKLILSGKYENIHQVAAAFRKERGIKPIRTTIKPKRKKPQQRLSNALPKHKVKLSDDAKIVKKLLLINTYLDNEHLARDFKHESESDLSINTIKYKHIPRAREELLQANHAPMVIRYKGHQYNLPQHADNYIISNRIGGRNLPHTILKHLVDGTQIEQKPLARKYGVGESTVKQYMKRIQTDQEGKGIKREFNKRGPGGATDIITKRPGKKSRMSYKARGEFQDKLVAEVEKSYTSGKGMNIQELANKLNTTHSTIQRHLKILQKSGRIRISKNN